MSSRRTRKRRGRRTHPKVKMMLTLFIAHFDLLEPFHTTPYMPSFSEGISSSEREGEVGERCKTYLRSDQVRRGEEGNHDRVREPVLPRRMSSQLLKREADIGSRAYLSVHSPSKHHTLLFHPRPSQSLTRSILSIRKILRSLKDDMFRSSESFLTNETYVPGSSVFENVCEVNSSEQRSAQAGRSPTEPK